MDIFSPSIYIKHANNFKYKLRHNVNYVSSYHVVVQATNDKMVIYCAYFVRCIEFEVIFI